VDKLARSTSARTNVASEGAMQRLKRRIDAEPAYHMVLYKILSLCETPRSLAQLNEAVMALPEMAITAHSSSVLIGWLQEVDGIEQTVDRKAGELWQTTAAGRQYVEAASPAKRLITLLADNPAFAEVFRQVLEFCRAPRSTGEIDDLLDSNSRLDELGVRPTFFVERLEDAGGLEWVDKHWRTTQAGSSLIDDRG
jgi:hypothetical protein